MKLLGCKLTAAEWQCYSEKFINLNFISIMAVCNLKNFTFIIIHALISLIIGIIPLHAATFSEEIRISGDRLTLNVEETPLSVILQNLKDQGVRVLAEPGVDHIITVQFKDRPIEEAFADLLKQYDYALVWEKSGGADGILHLVELQIFLQRHSPDIAAKKTSVSLDVAYGNSGRRLVRNSLLIRLSKEYSPEMLTALLSKYSASVIDYYEPLRIIRLQLPDGSDPELIAELLIEAGDVQAAEADYVYSLDREMPISGLSHLATSEIQSGQIVGESIIAVLDSGLTPEYGNNSYVRGTFDAISPDSNIQDTLGHGTQMALIAAGAVTPVGVPFNEEKISAVLAIRAIDDNGVTSTSTMTRAIDYAIEAGARVVSMSWGSETESPMMESVIDYASDKGLILVAAVGNEPTGEPVYPAAYPNVIGVGAVMPDGENWPRSNYGSFVTIKSPGLADLPVGYNGEPGVYAGTSISTAYAARKIAEAIDANPNADINVILQKIAVED